MKKRNVRIWFGMIAAILLLCAVLCGAAADGEPVITLREVGEVDLHTELQNRYLNDDYMKIADYADGTVDLSAPVGVLLHWDIVGEYEGDAKITVSTTADMQHPVKYSTNESYPNGEIVEEDGVLYFRNNGENVPQGIYYLKGYYYYVNNDGSCLRDKKKTIKTPPLGIAPGQHAFDHDGKMNNPPTEPNELLIFNLRSGMTYYWTVSVTSGGVEYTSEPSEIRTLASRWYNYWIDGVTNVRDIAANPTEDGSRIREGMIYRSGRFCHNGSAEPMITPGGQYTATEVLGIVTDLDIRRARVPAINPTTGEVISTDSGAGEFEGLTESPIGAPVELIHVNYDFDYMLSPEPMLGIFEVFSKEENYPIDFHCSIGTDRTGYAAYLLNGLLGVSREDSLRDYLFSNFGYIESSRSVSGILELYGDPIDSYPGETHAERTYNYLRDFVGVPAEQLDEIIRIMKVTDENEAACLGDPAQGTPAVGHTYTDWTVLVEPTCTLRGIRQRTCLTCGRLETRKFFKGHTVVKDPEIPRTCTVDGYTEGAHCGVCGYVITPQEKNEAKHDEVNFGGKSATCTRPGETIGKKCRVCGEITVPTTVIPAGHIEKQVVEVKPTCTEPGSYSGIVCAMCGETLSTEGGTIPATGHSERGTGGRSATCTEPGLSDKVYCTVCNAVLQEQTETPPRGHSGYRNEAVAPTCEKDGLTEGSRCKRCGYYLQYQEVIPALGHVPASVGAVAATCTTDGLTAVEYCTVCGKIFSLPEKVPASHSIVTHEAQDATCENDGWAAYETCENCDYTTFELIPAAGHRYENGTCTECGAADPDYIVENPFEDIRRKDWFYDDVMYAYSHGLFSGTKPNTFEPNTKTSRAMLVSVLWRIDGEPEPTAENKFTDVSNKKSNWYLKAVTWAAENQIVAGVGDGTKFDPNGNVTREQIASILFGYARFKGYPIDKTADITSYPDYKKVSKWARSYLSWANAEGLITGAVQNGKTVLDPQGDASRAVVASILVRFVKAYK